MLEHIYDPHSFLSHIDSFLPDGKHLVFSLPNLQEMMIRKYTNALNFEHTIFLTEPYIEYLLNQHNFRIIRREYFKKDHSIFYDCIRDSSVQKTKLPEDLFEKNKKLYLEYINFHKELINELNVKIKMLEKNQKLYLFGAHIFSQYLISFGLNVNHLDCIIDNDINKQGKRLYGTDFKVFSPKILNKDTDPVVILKAGVYDQEIKKDILKNINPNVKFW